jgi:hypothetical protein
VAAGTNGLLVGDGPGSLQQVPVTNSSTGQASEVTSSADIGAATGVVGEGPLLAGTNVVYPEKNAIVEEQPDGNHEAVFTLPSFDCSNAAYPYDPAASTTIPSHVSCTSYAKAISVDETGTVWYVSSAPGSLVGQLPPTAVTSGS